MSISISLTVNGKSYTIEAPPMKRLLDVLRQDLHLTGTKEGCGEGECGACSVIADGQLINSCLAPICQFDGAVILTVEGLAQHDQLHPLQQAFWQAGATQCGICTPGMLLAAKALLDQEPHPSHDQIKQFIAGNLCRCTGYTKIVEAIEWAARLGDGRPETSNTKAGHGGG
ncbi:MAG: (2Fe-2S)-binding protein [Acidobacteriota bacterium]|nr:(2Fe-2S)-binding protein [Blastocatellia bacterium]MDW8241443.1 (2Fe-2S)-binding protein [Acidobacteriota bacterium]